MLSAPKTSSSNLRNRKNLSSSLQTKSSIKTDKLVLNQKVFLLFFQMGHKDFAQDTYRTITAVDSVILVVDCIKVIEDQTRKLMKVCRMRNTPSIVFINKIDREGQDPFNLLE